MSSISGSGSGGGGGVGNVKFLQGNTGGPIGPDVSGTIFVPGGNNITAAGNAGTNTITFSVTGTTNHSVLLGNASGSINSLANGTTGQTLHAVTGADPVWSLVSLTNDVTGILPIANGGTNANGGYSVFGVNYFDGTRITSTLVGNSGQVLTSNGVGVAPTFQPNAGISQLNGDSGSAAGSPITFTAQGTAKAGTTWSFTGSGATMTLSSYDANGNIAIGAAGTSTMIADGVVDNIFIGGGAGSAISGAAQGNTIIGVGACPNIGAAFFNNAFGWHALSSYSTSGTGNDGNCAIGEASLVQLQTGTFNIALGNGSGASYTGAESLE